MSYPGQGYHSYGQNQQGNGYPPPPPSGGYSQGYPPPPPPMGYENQGYNQGYGPNGNNQGYQNYNAPPVPPHPSRANGNQGRYTAPSEGLGEHNQNNYQTNANYGGPAQNMGPTSMSYQAPPSGMQQFSGNAQGYNYQYSNCTGRRKALLIGINYIGSSNQLRGCINDVKNLSNFLNQRYGYQWDDMVILTDDQQNPRSIPTKANMLAAMQWLVKDAHQNDSLVFQYSGHGGQTKDLDGDEEDGYDEVIYPVDFQTAGSIVDDDMHAIMVRNLPPGCRLTALFDSCHSGTALDLPYVYSTQGVIKEPNLAKEAGEGLLSALTSYARGDLGGVFSSITGVVRQAGGNQSQAQKISRQTRTAPCDAISLSGCKDSQTSADTQEAGRATGAMSYAFVTVLSQNPNQSYLTLLQNMRSVLSGKYPQKPQLSASHPIDVNLQFIM